jgi:hypothetical protein
MMFAFASTSSLLLFSCGTSGSSTRDSAPDSLSPILEVASPASDPSSSLPVPVSVPAPNVVIDFNAGIRRINTVYNSSENNITISVDGNLVEVTVPNVTHNAFCVGSGRGLLGDLAIMMYL